MIQKTLNDKAQERFEQLKHKMKLDIQKPILQKAVSLTQEQIDKMSDVGEAQTIFNTKTNEAIVAVDFVEDTFSWINSLNLPPQLSLAIGLIISGHKTNNKQDIANAVVALGAYVNN